MQLRYRQALPERPTRCIGPSPSTCPLAITDDRGPDLGFRQSQSQFVGSLYRQGMLGIEHLENGHASDRTVDRHGHFDAEVLQAS